MGCCISRLKIDQSYGDQEETKSINNKKNTLYNKSELRRSKTKLTEAKKNREEKISQNILTKDNMSKKETSDDSNAGEKNFFPGFLNTSQDLTSTIKKYNECKIQKEFPQQKSETPNNKFDFIDFQTFSKNDQQTDTGSKKNGLMIQLNNKLHNSNRSSSIHETNSQYKSIKSNHTLNNYCSIHQINGNYQTHDLEYLELNNHQDFSNKISKKFCAFLLLEINNFVFSSKENFKYTYPELNLIMIFDFNDQISMREKLYFAKGSETDQTNSTYFPVLRKDELENKKYRIGKFFQINNNENFLFKITILLYTFTNHRILPIGSEDIFLKVGGNNSEMKKFHLYQNVHQRFLNKKIGNLNFDLSYKVDDFYYNQIVYERNILFNQLSEFQEFFKFEEEHEIIYKMFERINENNVNEENFQNMKKNYLSIHDLEHANFIQLYKSKEISSDRLYQLFQGEKSNRGYYILLKKLYDEMSNSEYTIQKLNNFKNLLNKKLEEILKYNDFTNEIIISLIFNVLKKSYYLIGKEKKSNISMSEQQGNDRLLRKMLSSPQLSMQDTENSDTEQSAKNSNSLPNNPIDGSIIEESLNLALKFLIIPKKENTGQNDKIEKFDEDHKDKGEKIFFLLSRNNAPKTPQKDENGNIIRRDEISINCLNFLYKFMEEPIVYENKYGETKTTENHLYEYIFENKFYNIIFDNLDAFTSYQDCVDPSLEILLKLLKIKKFNNNDLITEISKSEIFYDSTRKIIKVHDCNMKIMTKILSIIFYIKSEKFMSLLSITKLKNIFLIFRNIGFDLIHEVILYLVKAIISNRINTYHKNNPVKSLTRNNSFSIRNNPTRSTDKNPEDSNSPNTSLNNSNSSLNNSNSKKKITSNINVVNINSKLSPMKKSQTLNKHHTISNLKSVFNAVNDLNTLNNEDSTNINEQEAIDYGNFYPFERIIAEINGGLFSVEELNDVLSIFTPALNMIKTKLFYTDVQRNNKIFYKFINCVEVISFLILTLIMSKENTDKLKFLIYYKVVENLITIIGINFSKGIYKNIQQHYANKQYIMINNKIFIIKKFYFIFKITELIKERFPNLKDEKLQKYISDYKNHYRYILENEFYNPDYLIQVINDIFKDIPIDENNQKKQKLKTLEDLKVYLKEMKRSLMNPIKR